MTYPATESRSQTMTPIQIYQSQCEKVTALRSKHAIILGIIAIIIINCHYDLQVNERTQTSSQGRSRRRVVLLASSHIVLTKDDNGQSLVLTGEDGKGKGKGKGGGGDQLVIAGHGMGGGDNSNMVMQDAANREGDVVINGNSMIVPGEDGHIVLADSRSNQQSQRRMPPPNLWAFWAPFLRGRMAYSSPYFGFPFG